MNKQELTPKIQDALSKSKKRGFTQSVELTLNFNPQLKLESSEHKLNLNITLPKGRGKDLEVGVFADGDMNVRAKKLSKHVLSKPELEDMAKSRRKMRAFAKECYSFIAQTELMSTIGKQWGIVLGVRGKMPQPAPPNADLKQTIERAKNTVRVRTKKDPTVHVPVGVESMTPEDLAENVLAVYNAVEAKLHAENITSGYVKTTMGEAVRLW